MSEAQSQLKEISDEVDKAINTSSNKKVVPTATAAADAVNFKNLSDGELVQYLQAQEIKKMTDRIERQRLKGLEVPKEHKFWNTQPVPQLMEEVTEGNSAINEIMTVDQVKQEPYNMPAGFEWCSLDINDPAQVLEVYNLLNENYVEDDDCMFRFDYSVPFLQWALTPPGFVKDWHVGVRNSKTGVLMGCITAVPVDVRVYDVTSPMAEINFLCVHKKLRTKRLAPVLIKEITRRVNILDRWQAVYTAGVVLPKPVGKCRYHHRSLNPKKLIEVRFSSLPPKTTMANHIKTLKLNPRPTHEALRPMEPADVKSVHALLNNYLSTTTSLAQVFSEEDVAHILLPRKGVVNSYVIADASGTVTDLCSFYHLPSTIIGNAQHNKLNAVYSYYNIATTVPMIDLMRDLLVVARNEGADVMNALDLMENGDVLKELQFGAGDGFLQYYVYNWRCPQMPANKVGLVLL